MGAVRALGQEEVVGPVRALGQEECQQGTWAARAGCCVGQCAGWFVVFPVAPGKVGVEERERCLGVGGAGGCLGSVIKAHPSLSSRFPPVRSRGSPRHVAEMRAWCRAFRVCSKCC